MEVPSFTTLKEISLLWNNVATCRCAPFIKFILKMMLRVVWESLVLSSCKRLKPIQLQAFSLLANKGWTSLISYYIVVSFISLSCNSKKVRQLLPNFIMYDCKIIIFLDTCKLCSSQQAPLIPFQGIYTWVNKRKGEDMGIKNRAREGLGSLRGEIGLFLGFEVWECVFKQLSRTGNENSKNQVASKCDFFFKKLN